MALGTLATPSAELLQRIVEALDDGPWAIIWALPKAHQARLPKKLSEHWYVDKFLPQVALFQKTNRKSKIVSCFISHCGGSSTTEAMSNGIPMVCLPFFGDQYEWAASVSSFAKAGVRIDKTKSTSKDIKKAVETVLNNSAYREKSEAVAARIAGNAEMRLDYLHASRAQKRLGLPVAAAVIEKCMARQNPQEALPENFRPKMQSKTQSCSCFG